MAIGKFVPLMAQVVEKHIDTCKLLQNNLQYYISLPVMILSCLSKYQIKSMYRYVPLPLVP